MELFGLLTSKMHMVWLKNIGGKLETRYRYSAGIVYNTFPVPKNYESLKPFAENILIVRKKHPNLTLVDLYSPYTMPSDLKKAHKSLDKKVDGLYRKDKFKSDSARFEYLMKLYASNNES